MIQYQVPSSWMLYDPRQIISELVEARGAVLSLKAIPYQKEWIDTLQQLQLKREVAGTSRIEGADFTENELEAALKETPEQLLTRSQRQAHAAVGTYRWLATLPDDRPVDASLMREIHTRIVTGADDDHCPPGQIRGRDQNVNFGVPRHRGVEGGEKCTEAFAALSQAVQREFPEHDLLIQALALHYQFAAMHPFLDGNGRTARALEALMLQRAGLRNALFIPMSNYYYDEKKAYLATLSEVRAKDHDLTPFLAFGLRGIAIQCTRLLDEIRTQVAKALFRNLMYDLFNRLRTPRKRVIVRRQLEILKLLLTVDSLDLEKLVSMTDGSYQALSNPRKAVIRDLNYLINLGAVSVNKLANGGGYKIAVRLEWPTEITETAFFERVRMLPKGKTYSFLQ
jgi:Fic family protein